MIDHNIANALDQVVQTQADRIGLVTVRDGKYRSRTFAELLACSTYFASDLARRGVQRGDRVLLMVRPSMEFVCLTFALFRLGAVVILIDPGMGYRNLLTCINRVQPRILIGISRAILFSRIARSAFATVSKRINVDSVYSGKACQGTDEHIATWQAAREDLAAIIFTTGSTGPPKGVQYTHGIFSAQLQLIRDYFGVRAGDVDQPGFPLFGLFSIALGARIVIPDMDPTRPARVDPVRFIRSIIEQQVTFSFGSPAIWNVVSRHCLEHGIVLPIRKILMAGAPVPGELIERVRRIMARDGGIYTPYGATECLPVASITGKEILTETWPLTRQGRGTCVGRSLPGMDIRIIRPVKGTIASLVETEELAAGEVGEIIVRGPVVTRAYDHDPEQTKLAKIADNDIFWHRMGDMGYMDRQGRLWFCGRKAHRVHTREGILHTIPVEGIFNRHPQVVRSALVGVGEPGRQRPVLVVESGGRIRDKKRFLKELQEIAASHELTRPVTTFLLHRGFPVDIRHNAKIFREKLAIWARRRLRARACLKNKDCL